jgi:hypothetical protein
MIWIHGGLRLTKGPVPGGRRAASVGFCAMPGECRAPPALSTNKSDNAGSCQATMESFYHIEHKEHKDIRRRQGFGGQGGPKNEFFFVIFVIFVVKNLLKFFAFRRLRWNDAGYKNNFK